ncbi:branched-chain amino acid ABC transporter permease [Nocardioides sp. ChNu-153]|uniref:ABC transporter permease subunit n=1 Tax=Nocardioides sp. ChNu-153 TaxID=2779364 RepID=UPI002651570F|nr:SpaA isopeptide-forming pilin-related protein [Nocardioides sp. ChNu-153]MDN7121289.1 branched-chain amino acid ABC transporter permease [Nocardioides sp. ChNu-153]
MALLALLVVLMLPLSAAHAAEETDAPTPSPSAGATSEPGSGETTAPAAQPPAEGPYVRVRLLDEAADEPVAGVTLTVESEGGEEVGSAQTDPDGVVIVPIPELGTYTVTLDEDSLPDGIELGDDTKSEITITARINGANGGLFPIGVQEVESVSFADRLTTSLVSGVKFGLIVALAALGLSLIFGTTGLTNFAHGELITFGALATYVANRGLGMPVVLAGVVAVVVSAAFGWAQDRGLWRPLRRRGTGLIAMMIVSIGLSLLLRNLYQYSIGSSRKSLSEYVSQARTDYGIVSLADKEIAIIGISVVTIVVVCIALMRTRMGKAMRAVSDNPALSASSGLKVDRVISSVWVLGTALTGLAGVLLAINSQINFLMGFKLLLLVFAAVTLGGLGTIWGALFGSMVIGIMVEVGPLFGVPSSIKEVGALVVLILVLLIRPQGILGRRERIG